MNKYLITYNYFPEVEKTELDLQLYTDLAREGVTDEDIQDIHDREYVGFADGWSGEAPQISVKELKAVVEALPTEATHVEIFHHVDHGGYHFYPVEIKLSEQSVDEEKARLRAELDKKIAELDKRIMEMNGSLTSLMSTRAKLGK